MEGSKNQNPHLREIRHSIEDHSLAFINNSETKKKKKIQQQGFFLMWVTTV